MNATEQPEIRAAGAVLYRQNQSGQPLVALVHRPHHNDWSLPKGKLDPGETSPVTAVRELREETGYVARLGPFLRQVHYEVPTTKPDGVTAGINKTVDYFAAPALSGRFEASSEVDALRWLPLTEAIELTSYVDDVAVLQSFHALPRETTTVALVCPADADNPVGSRTGDHPSPLSEVGLRQAAALCDMLHAFDPHRVLAAPEPNCARTVHDCAATLELPVENEPQFSGENRTENPESSTRRLDALAASSGTTVMCGPRRVIGYLVDAFASRDRVELPVTGEASEDGRSICSESASLWLLSFHENTATGVAANRPSLLRASYFANPIAD